MNNQDLIFCVSEFREVDEKDLSVLEETQNTRLTLVTCIAGKYNKRYIVECDLIQASIGGINK